MMSLLDGSSVVVPGGGWLTFCPDRKMPRWTHGDGGSFRIALILRISNRLAAWKDC